MTISPLRHKDTKKGRRFQPQSLAPDLQISSVSICVHRRSPVSGFKGSRVPGFWPNNLRNLRLTVVLGLWFLVLGPCNSGFWPLLSALWIIRFLNLRNLRISRPDRFVSFVPSWRPILNSGF